VNYFLDTNAVIALLRNQPTAVRGRLRRVVSRGASIGVSSAVLYELWYGVARSERRCDSAERLRVFLSGNIDVIPFDEHDAVAARDLRAACIPRLKHAVLAVFGARAAEKYMPQLQHKMWVDAARSAVVISSSQRPEVLALRSRASPSLSRS